MGLLALGTPLAWPEAKKKAGQVREWGIEQLLAIWNRAKGKERDALLWGDEVQWTRYYLWYSEAYKKQIEYLVVAYEDEHKKVKLSLRQADILDALAKDEALCKQGGCVPDLQSVEHHGDVLPIFHPEFGRFMLEATPGKPWGIGFKDLLDVEHNMKWRRKIAIEHMEPNEYPITLTTFPRLGTKDEFMTPYYPPSGERLRSQFLPDEIANPHIRFPTLAANIRSRRGRKVEINVPVFQDSHTTRPFNDPTVDYDLHEWPEDDDVRNGAAKQDHIYMDAMGFGMGSCCLQITFQSKNITEGRRLYDQLSPLGPILLALTAATPIYKGFLADTDVRWNQISRAVDDRTQEELGEKPLKNERWRVPKSRYASNSTYISQDPRLREEYMDPDLVIDEKVKQRLLDGGMDDLLATHFAHLFIRDPIVIFNEDLQTLDLTKTDHFENLQSTNWQHMRFKPPPPDKDTGWRVEFRPMEIQITDFENAAFSVFIVLITRAILSFDLNFYIPIPLTTQNMETAHTRDAVLHEKFHFRNDPLPPRPVKTNGVASGTCTPAHISRPATPTGPVEDEHSLMTINEIVNGQTAGGSFPGLILLVESYLNSVNVDVETRCELARYLDLIRKRASGQLWTGAKWIRHFVREHREYRHDSVVSEEITYDLLKAVEEITKQEGKGRGIGREMLKADEPVKRARPSRSTKIPEVETSHVVQRDLKEPATPSSPQHDKPAETEAPNTENGPAQNGGHHIPRPHLPHHSNTDRAKASSPMQIPAKGTKDSKASLPASPGRRNSWMSTLSSKFSSSSNSPSIPSSPATPQTGKTSPSSPFENPNPFGAAILPGSKDAKKSDPANASPSSTPPKTGHPSFLSSALRRLSSSSGATLTAKASGGGGIVARKVMNVDPYRERCEIPDLEPAKLRRVSFSVDVEIAAPAKYSKEEPEEPPPAPPTGRRPSLTALEKQADIKKRKDQRLKKDEGAALKNPHAVTTERESEGVVNASGEKVQSEKHTAVGSVNGEASSSRKKEKKKRSEGERKVRNERKRNEAVANGEKPRELRQENSYSSGTTESPPNGSHSPTKSSDRPTTDPLRIYRRCCQLRETPILKRITEQISSPSACHVTTPGIVSCLDLSGFWMQLPDIVTLGDYLAVVPVKKLVLEDCGLGDEAIRVILAGLLAAKTPEQAKHNKKLCKKAIEDIKHGKAEKLGVVEKLSLKNNPKIGKEGWRHICLFLYMSRTLKAIDLSGIPLPQPSTGAEGSQAAVDIPTLIEKAIAGRLGGSCLEELVMGECGITLETVEKIVESVMQCGVSRLGLASNDITADGLHHILRYLKSGRCEGLDLGGNDLSEHLHLLADALDDKNPLYALSLADCKLTAASLSPLFPALVKLPNFRFIDLSHNRDLFTTEPNAISILRKYLPRMPILKRVHMLDVAMTPDHAIALAEILPESKTLAHLNILENHLLSPLASAKGEASQEEACALYASLMAAVRVSKTIICIDIDIPTQESSEVVKALAKQVVAYSLRNLERLPLNENTESAAAAVTDTQGSEKPVTVPDVLLHLVGHAEGSAGDLDIGDEPAPDDDYIVGGTGVVKALGVCLNRSRDARRGSRDASPSPFDSGTATPKRVLQGSEVHKGKAKEMSKNLLGSARKIRTRLQPALVNEARAGDSMSYKRLQFLDSTLSRMIERFEDEYPECRLTPETPPQSSPTESPRPSSPEVSSPTLTDYRSEAFGIQSPPTDAPISSETHPLNIPISRRPSDTSLASRQAAEEGRMHRIGQRLRRDVLRPQTLDYAHGTTGDESEAGHLTELRKRCEGLSGEDIRRMYTELGAQGMLEALGTTAEELKMLEELDPGVREGRVGELLTLERLMGGEGSGG